MKKALLVYGAGLIIVASTSLALAQPDGERGYGHDKGKGKHGNPEQRMERMRQHLDLSDAQMEQMRAIRESDATHEEKRSQMQSILSDEQRSMMEEHRARKREMRQQRGGYPESDETT